MIYDNWQAPILRERLAFSASRLPAWRLKIVYDTWETPARQEPLVFSAPQTPLRRLEIVYDTSEIPAGQERLVAEAPEPRMGWNENAARVRKSRKWQDGIRGDRPQPQDRHAGKWRLAAEAASW
jgi:hypothetical protein